MRFRRRRDGEEEETPGSSVDEGRSPVRAWEETWEREDARWSPPKQWRDWLIILLLLGIYLSWQIVLFFTSPGIASHGPPYRPSPPTSATP